MEITFLISGVVAGMLIGGLIAWLIVKQKSTGVITRLQTQLDAANKSNEENHKKLAEINGYWEQEKNSKSTIERNLVESNVKNEGLQKEVESLEEKLLKSEKSLTKKTDELNGANQRLATYAANNEALEEKLNTQKEEMEKMAKKFNTEFENIANKILEEKTEKFTRTNKTNIETLLKPLGIDLEKFKQKVDDVYNKEAKERFSLGEKVKELMGLNAKLSDDAQNLTAALKGGTKAQGNWGEMILEGILEKSGLTKGQEYVLQNFLKDAHGNYILSSDGKKMQPDAIIQYPDDRKVIVDSKVSLNAYVRYAETDDVVEQEKHLQAHLGAIKDHIKDLSKKGYDDFEKSLDFVMMFVPNEPAFLVALKKDPDLWHFAYEKRILLISPTNLIAALKMISDLWKREAQNQNAKAISERGGKLYDKFVLFSENFKKVGKNIDSAQSSYNDAFKQLATGSDNLVRQAEKLRALKVDSKKVLAADFREGNDPDDDVLELE